MTETPLLVTTEAIAPASGGVNVARDLGRVISLAQAGDAEAFATLVTDLHRPVFRWALTFARDADEADEITQETFVMLHRKLEQYRGDSSIEGWVYGITRSIALQRKRRKRRREFLSQSVLPGLDTAYHTDPGARVDRQRIADSPNSVTCGKSRRSSEPYPTERELVNADRGGGCPSGFRHWVSDRVKVYRIPPEAGCRH